MIYEFTKEHLTEDDLKVAKHLRAINNLFKKGNLSVSSIFVDNGTLKLMKNIENRDYTVEDYHHITCDGGDPDRYGKFGIYSQEELEELYESEEYDNEI